MTDIDESARSIGALEADMAGVKAQITALAINVAAIRTTTDRAAGQWAVVTLIIGPALGAISAAIGGWFLGVLHLGGSK